MTYHQHTRPVHRNGPHGPQQAANPEHSGPETIIIVGPVPSEQDRIVDQVVGYRTERDKKHIDTNDLDSNYGGRFTIGLLDALGADLTREEVRTRAMAIVRMTLGLSFAVAIVLGAVFAGLFGVPGIFWLSTGKTEGQITCLKALKRAMYWRASVKRLCVRMRPLANASSTKFDPEPFKRRRDTGGRCWTR